MTSPRVGIAVLAKGFRPFFLVAAIQAVVTIPLWLLAFAGAPVEPGHLPPMYWHAHEMVFGFTTAVIAGFLLTAVSNWTNRPTASGPVLAVLVAVWLAGRVAMWSAGGGLVALLDAAFLPALTVSIAVPLLQSGSQRNYGFVALLLLLAGANLLVHLGALGHLPEGLRLGNVLGIDIIAVVIVVITGRIVPMFTRNATRVATIRSIPWLDRLAIAGAVSVVVCDAATLVAPLSAALIADVVAGVTGAVVLARAVHWGFGHTWRQPLLWVLHLGHAWVGIGLLARGGTALGMVPASAALHALTVGAIGLLTLGMMVRVTLGHTGRLLAVPPIVTAAFALMAVAALLRTLAPLLTTSAYVELVTVAGVLWSASFLVFLMRYSGALISPRADGRPG